MQERLGSRTGYASMEQRGGWNDVITPDLAAFISERDTFFIATVSANGQPYMQHRGGPPGFLKVLDEYTLGFADFSGNRQYISVGNLDDNPKAFIFLMDYANSRRIKLWGTARVVEDDLDLLERLQDPDYPGRVERAILFSIEAWDVNCPQHIHKRFPQAVVAPIIEKLQGQVRELQAKLAEYKQAEKSSANPILTDSGEDPATIHSCPASASRSMKSSPSNST